MAADAIRLRENIYQIQAKCKVYLVRGTRRNVLIDTGLESDIEVIDAQLAQCGLTRDDIDIIILTHEHMDHIGGVPAFATRAIVAAHTLAANKIGLQDEFVLMNKAFGHKAEDFHIDIMLHHGTSIDLGGRSLITIHTPGHCSGSICLYEPNERVLFTGDTIFAGGTLGGILPSGNISDYVATLRHLSSIKVTELYPGHGRISKTPDEDFERAIKGSIGLMNDTKTLFDALTSQEEFSQVMKSVSAYSKRV